MRMSALTLVGVTGHFISYTFIVVIIRDVVGLRGPHLAWLLAAYGIAGLAAMALLARPGDRRPKAAIMLCLTGSAAAFAVLAVLGCWGRHNIATLICGIAAVLLWGALATAMPPMLQSAAMRHCPDDPDGASGVYVAAFQIGIMSGSLLGGLLYQFSGVPAVVAASAALMLCALACLTVSRGLLSVTPHADSQ
jgi:predicted MFS family arabinose efflux permease